MMHVNFNLSVIIILYISKMSSSFLNVLQKILYVRLMIKFLFHLHLHLHLVVGARANAGPSSGAPWFDAGLTVCSIIIIFTSLALTPCNFAVQLGH